MDKKIFERFEIREKENNVPCLPVKKDFFRAIPKEYPQDAFLIFQKTKNSLSYFRDKVSLPLSDERQIIAFLGRPYMSYSCRQTGKKMYGAKIAYLKTQENQEILDYSKCEIIETLSEKQGILEFLSMFFLPYDDYIRVAVEYKHGSIRRNHLKHLASKIIEIFFVCDNTVFGNFHCVQSYTKGEFEDTFNQSKRNKKVIFYPDIVDINGTEILNSVKHEFSLKCSTTINDSLKEFVRNKFSFYNAVRYVLKCENSESKTDSFEGISEDFDEAQKWTHPARIFVQEDSELLFSFLEMKD